MVPSSMNRRKKCKVKGKREGKKKRGEEKSSPTLL